MYTETINALNADKGKGRIDYGMNTQGGKEV
jgi:hypothetical protein